jgi:hypothetical protein
VYEQPQPGRRIGPALVALIVVLAAAAGTVGYLGARQILDGSASGNPNSSGGSGATSPSTSGSGQTSPAQTSPTTPGQATPTTTTPATTGPTDRCPDVTVQAVKAAGRPGQLQLALYIETPVSEVWICRDSDDELFYQGRLKPVPLTAATSKTTLLLGEGVRGRVDREGDGFVAINPGTSNRRTEYHVSRQYLVTRNVPGQQRTYEVINYNDP